jgi:hypothetical protein
MSRSDLNSGLNGILCERFAYLIIVNVGSRRAPGTV